MTRQPEQCIKVVDHTGEVSEFAGDHYQLMAGPLGIRMIFDESSPTTQCVWTEPLAQGGVRVQVTVANPRAGFQPGGDVWDASKASVVPSPTVVN